MTGHRSAGFTLVETLVSLIVLGFIVAGLVQGLHFGMTAWDRQVRYIDRDSALDSTDRIVRMLVSRMVPSNDPHVSAIEGDADQLSFTADLPANAPAYPTRLADLTLDGSAGHRFVLRWAPHLHARRLLPARPQTVTLLRGIRQVTFAYFGRQGGGDSAVWMDHWQGAGPPELIRVHFNLGNRSQQWPDVIVAPMCETDDD